MSRGDVLGVVDFGSVGVTPLNQMFHNGYPKLPQHSLTVPSWRGALWYMFLGGTAPGEIERFFAHCPKMTSTCIRLFLQDHTYDRLNHVRDDIERFVNDARHARSRPQQGQVRLSGRRFGTLSGRQRRALPARPHQHHLRAGGDLPVLRVLVPVARSPGRSSSFRA